MKFSKKIILLIFLFIIIFSEQKVYSIKTEVLNYKIFTTDNFEVYFSRDEVVPIFNLTEDFLETTFVKETEFFRTKFENRIPFFLFYGKKNFFQNTILDVSEGTGGVTEAFKNRILLPFEGSKKKFQHVINHEFIHEIQFNILYSGFWRTPRLLKSVFYPYWLMEGLAEYRSRDFVRTEQEMMVRDMAVSGKLIPIEHLHNFAHLKPHTILPAYEQSAKLMEYIAKEYGDKRVVDLLYVFRDKFDPNTVLNIVCGTDIKSLDRKFKEEMIMQYNYEVKINSMTDFDEKYRITKKTIFPTKYNLPITYEDKLIYLGDPSGQQVFYIKSLTTGKENVLINREKLKSYVDYINLERISVSKNGLLCFSGIKNNTSYLYLYNIKNKKMKMIRIEGLDFINSQYIFPYSDLIAVVGTKNSQTDIYFYNLNSLELRKITFDGEYKFHVTVSPNEKKIAYAKEFFCVKNIKEYENGLHTYQTDIVVLDIENNLQQNISKTLSDEYYPNFISEDKILFISDYHENYEKQFFGVYNIFYKELNNDKNNKLTNVIGGIYHPHYNDGKIYFCYYRNFESQIFVQEFNYENLYNNTLGFIVENKDFELKNLVEKKYFQKKYKFNFSTDLFLPFLYYSSLDGLAAIIYWQGSDMIGENNLSLYSLMLGDKNFSYNLSYQYSRFRTKFFLGLLGENNYYNYYEKIFRKYNEINFGVSYPINKNSDFGVFLGYPIIEHNYELYGKKNFFKENIVTLTYAYYTLVRKYLEPTQGNYQRFMIQISDKIFDGDYSYKIFKYNFINYFDLGKEYSLFTKINYNLNTGRDEVLFKLNSYNAVRGVERDIYSREILYGTVGFRMPLVYDINYYMWFMFPDLFFKGLYLEIFFDYGIDVKTVQKIFSSGISLKLYTFIIQSYPLNFILTYAQQVDEKTRLVPYFMINVGI